MECCTSIPALHRHLEFAPTTVHVFFYMYINMQMSEIHLKMVFQI